MVRKGRYECRIALKRAKAGSHRRLMRERPALRARVPTENIRAVVAWAAAGTEAEIPENDPISDYLLIQNDESAFVVAGGGQKVALNET